MSGDCMYVSFGQRYCNEKWSTIFSQSMQILQGGLAMNWYCLCGNYVRERRFCPRCKIVRFRLNRLEVIDYFGIKIGLMKDVVPFHFPINRLGKHMLISGQTGTGKSRFSMNLATKAENFSQDESLKLLIIDVEGEWSGIIPNLIGETTYFDVGKNLRINPFDLKDSALIRELMRETIFKGIEKEYSDLSAQMNFVLNHSIEKSTNIAELIENIKNYHDQKLSAIDRTKTALLVRLDPFLHSPLKEIFVCKKSTIDWSSIDKQNIIINLHSLDAKVSYNEELRLIYNIITTYYLRKMLSRSSRNSLSNIFIADEAQLLVPKILHKLVITESWPATEFATRLRKRGCGLMLITQSPYNIESDIFKNIGTKITFRLQHLEDIRLIADSCGFIDKTELQYLANNFVKLNQQQAIVTTYDREPFLITAINYEPKKYHPEITTLETTELPIANTEKKLDSDENRFLESIAQDPYLTVFDRRGILGWNHERYSQVVAKLQKKGQIEKIPVKLGRGSPIILYQKKGTIPGIRHEFYVNWIQGKLNSKGISSRLNKKQGPDIIVQNTNTAIEVELGTSDMLENARRDSEQFDRVLVCSDSDKILENLSSKIKHSKIFFCKIQDVPSFFEQKKR